MHKKKLMALFVVFSLFSGLVIPKVHAESIFQPEKFPLTEMQVQVMPEFDYPEDWSKDVPALLVGQYGTFTNKTGQDFDGKLEVPVPAKEKDFQVYLVAEFPDENKPEVQRPYDVDKEKGVVTWKPAKAIKNNETYKFVIEYYSKTINIKDKKSFTYQFTNTSPVDQLDIIFYAPMNAKEIQLEPKAASTEKSEYGEELFYYQYKNVKPGESLKYNFSYKKDNTESTMEAINKLQPPNDENHSGVSATDQVKKNAAKSTSEQPIIGMGGAIIIGLAVVIAGIFIFLGLKGNSKTVATQAKSKKPEQKKPTAKKEPKVNNEDEKKELRKKLLTGKIDQEMYEEEMKKLI